jgi:hypothetical protein
MKTEFDNLKNNNEHGYQTDSNGEKQTVKIFHHEQLIAKMVKLKKSIRYFGAPGYQQYLTRDAE